MKVLKVRMRALTSSFRLPFAYAGFQLAQPVPSYSNLLGILSSCAGRNIQPTDTNIGFEFSSEGKGEDIERFIRWDFNNGKPKLNSKGPGVRKRDYLINPSLTLYLSNLDLKKIFEHPIGIFTLGRSQDVAWIDLIEIIEVKATTKGSIGGTLIPAERLNQFQNGILFRLPEYMHYDNKNHARTIGKQRLFLATNNNPNIRTPIEMKTGLFSPLDSQPIKNCFYLHDWN